MMFVKYGLNNATIIDSSNAYTCIAARRNKKVKVNKQTIINDFINGDGCYAISRRYNYEYRDVARILKKYKLSTNNAHKKRPWVSKAEYTGF